MRMGSANMPPSVEKGQQGINTAQLRILADGNVLKDFVKLVVSSETADLDVASLEGSYRSRAV